MKRLIFDIETSHSIMASFSLWDPTPHTNILKEWYIICAAWKWDGENETHAMSGNGDDDSEVVKELAALIEEADELVYHNGRKFDFKKLQTRALYHGLPPIPKPREVDTLLQARKHFGFTSNRLDYIAKYLGVGGKMSTTSGLWLRALDGDEEAIDEMLDYNIIDVEILQDVFHKMQPYIDVGYNRNHELHDRVCASCGSKDIISRGHSYTAAGKYRRIQCKSCGKWGQLKGSIGSTEVR